MIDHAQQITNAIMMIRPASFCSNPQTIGSNSLQNQSDELDRTAVQQEALQEFDALVIALRGAGINVTVFNDEPEPETPDALFPNNWISTHADGTTVLYPMMAENRRLERNYNYLQKLQAEQKFHIANLIDLSGFEANDRFLEGTGSLVLDRHNKIAYAALSPRTHLDLVNEFCKELAYTPVAFHSGDEQGIPYYHTNVVMCVGNKVAIVCGESIIDNNERNTVCESLTKTGHQLVDISRQQLHSFAGNALALQTTGGSQIFAMSQRANDSLTENQRATLQHHGEILSVPINLIENYSGGSVRCMIAEIFLPRE